MMRYERAQRGSESMNQSLTMVRSSSSADWTRACFEASSASGFCMKAWTQKPMEQMKTMIMGMRNI